MKIYVTHTKTGFQWGTHPGRMVPLETPISTKSLDGVTFELLVSGPKGIFYRLQNGQSGKLRPSEGTDLEVPVGGKRQASFSTSSSGDYESGTLEVERWEKK